MSGARPSMTMSASPTTGNALPDYRANGERVAAAMRLMLDIYIPDDVQEDLIDHLIAFAAACAGMRGVPLPGRGLSALSQAGKSKTITETAKRINAIEPPNLNRMVHIELTERISVKMLFQRMLARIGDPEAMGRYNVEVLRQRCAELFPAAGTQLLAIDEVQLLGKLTTNNYEVADALKSLIDAGVVAILFAGNEKAKEIFDVNEQLRGRLGVPLELAPADPKLTADRLRLWEFAAALDEAIADSGVIGASGLARADYVRRIGKASGGHIGRFCRIVGAALEHACARGAERIEPYDLSYAVRNLAIPARWTAKNPFPEPAHW